MPSFTQWTGAAGPSSCSTDQTCTAVVPAWTSGQSPSQTGQSPGENENSPVSNGQSGSQSGEIPAQTPGVSGVSSPSDSNSATGITAGAKPVAIVDATMLLSGLIIGAFGLLGLLL